ncbi:hypothetical protein PR202_ga14842 [Eleusine coracana subsp. coracana]|uniref:Formamidopyrimidine-DNA glycosylase catalytic domain-containing protein n=1 Tax=Eleusine coracana subsp. coracana TaxID=191504 RepID=A0AAV5CIS3_ELECO|nr:hypothetical protein PR202_ga14842 [Eleusine coracana subsp. coracana]
MPELPEVEAARRALEAHCLGRRIARCVVADDDKVVVAGVGRVAFERAMVGKTIVAARRRGKNLWLHLDAPPFPSFQFGPDALFEPMSVANFSDSLGKKKIGIKALLLDQSFISGIGNWIADEVLYQSRIHPLQIASSLSRDSCEALHKSILEVVTYAVEVDADCDRFPEEWLFHHRWGKKPGKVNGKKIEFITAGGRTTAYVPQLQKLTGVQSSKMEVANLEQLASSVDAEDKEADAEDNGLKPKKRVITSKAASGARKTRRNAGENEKSNVKTTEPNKDATDSNAEHGLDKPTSTAGEKSEQVTRRSSRNKVKPQASKLGQR